MEIIVQTEEYEGKTVGVKARKLPPNYETDWYVDEDKHTFREFVVEIEDYRIEEMTNELREKEWKSIRKQMEARKPTSPIKNTKKSRGKAT
jgi:hypothetical protein